MLEFLLRQLAKSDSFVLHITDKNDQLWSQCGMYSADSLGIAFECGGRKFCWPWDYIRQIEVE